MRSAHPRVQALLVQAGWRVWRSRRPETEPLRQWTRSIADRRGKKVAVVALARRLARILFGMWRDETDFAAEAARSWPPAAAHRRAASHREDRLTDILLRR